MGRKKRVAVFGATKFGRWHVREYLNAGCEIAAILGSSDESARKTADSLNNMFGCSPRAYGDINRLLEKEKLDLISIVTPPPTHYALAQLAISRGIDFLLEKPSVRGADFQETLRMYSNLMEDSEKEGVMFANQHQNVAFLDEQFPSILERAIDGAEYFLYNVMNGGNRHGMDLAEDQLPHPLSVLTRILGPGEASSIEREIKEEGPVSFKFNYTNKKGNCFCRFSFQQVPSLTREENILRIGFDGDIITRRQADDGSGLRQWFEYNGREHPLRDPLSISISSFVKGKPLVSAEDGLNTLKAQIALQYGGYSADSRNSSDITI